MLEIVQLLLGALLVPATIYTVWEKPKWFYYILFFLLIAGQLARLPLPIGDNGVLIADIIVPLGFFVWLCNSFFYRKKVFTSTSGIVLLLFSIIAFVSVLLNIPELPTSELITTLFYLFRLYGYIGLFYMSYDYLQEKELRRVWMKGLLISAVALSLLGIVQLIVFPDFTFMAQYGWDPHIGRLLSTWYDPNYLAGFFAMIISIYFSLWYFEKKKSMAVIMFLLLIGVCFILTFSRSGILALGIMIAILGILKMRTLLILTIIIFAIALGTSERLQERFGGLADGAIAVITGSLDHDVDITSLKRIESWNESLRINDGNELFGIGYNSIAYRKLSKGLVTDTDIHSASGSDSSLLNIYLTTGALGLGLFLYFLLSLLWKSILLYNKKSNSSEIRSYALGFFAMLLGLIAHSFFVNSLLLPFFLMVLFPLVAILEHYWHAATNASA